MCAHGTVAVDRIKGRVPVRDVVVGLMTDLDIKASMLEVKKEIFSTELNIIGCGAGDQETQQLEVEFNKS